MIYSEHTAPGTSGDFNEDLPSKQVVKLTKNPDGSPQEVNIDPGTALVDADSAMSNELENIGVNGDLVTKIESVGEVFYIVRLRPQDYSQTPGRGYEIFNAADKKVSNNSARRIQPPVGEDPLVLIHVNDKGNSHDKPALTARGIHTGIPIYVGRQIPPELDDKADRFDVSGNAYMSARHFNLLRNRDGSMKLEVTSSNRTTVSYAEKQGVGVAESVDALAGEVYDERPATDAEKYNENALVHAANKVVDMLRDDHVYLASTAEIDTLLRYLGAVRSQLAVNKQAETARHLEVVDSLLDLIGKARNDAAHSAIARSGLKKEVLPVAEELLAVRKRIRDTSIVRTARK